jgi:hypothetical protein
VASAFFHAAKPLLQEASHTVFAPWVAGSRAYLDSRGLLHLKSSHAGIPELTLVLSDGVLGGWCANGGVFGPAYFTGTTTRENGEIQESIFDSVLRGFVMRLP